jgi:RsiW-degrading membrane proteinase PrsW (M82 family)
VTIVLWIALAIGAITAGWLVWRHDLYDRDPWWLLAIAGAIGVLLAAGCGRIEDRVIYAASRTPSAAGIAAVAAATEEIARLVALAALAMIASARFRDPLNGVTYGSVVGLGMSAWESWMHFAGAPLDPPGAQELVRLFAHAVLGGIVGFPLGMFALGRPGRWLAVGLCTGATLGLHFLVDWVGLRIPVVPEFEFAGTAIVAGAVLFGALLYGGLTGIAAEWSRQRYAPCDPRSLFGWPLTLIVPPPELPAWCPPGAGGVDTPAPGAGPEEPRG